jgi:hypothetical protein
MSQNQEKESHPAAVTEGQAVWQVGADMSPGGGGGGARTGGPHSTSVWFVVASSTTMGIVSSLSCSFPISHQHKILSSKSQWRTVASSYTA